MDRNIPFSRELEVERHMTALQRLNVKFFHKFIILWSFQTENTATEQQEQVPVKWPATDVRHVDIRHQQTLYSSAPNTNQQENKIVCIFITYVNEKWTSYSSKRNGYFGLIYFSSFVILEQSVWIGSLIHHSTIEQTHGSCWHVKKHIYWRPKHDCYLQKGPKVCCHSMLIYRLWVYICFTVRGMYSRFYSLTSRGFSTFHSEKVPTSRLHYFCLYRFIALAHSLSVALHTITVILTSESVEVLSRSRHMLLFIFIRLN